MQDLCLSILKRLRHVQMNQWGKSILTTVMYKTHTGGYKGKEIEWCPGESFHLHFKRKVLKWHCGLFGTIRFYSFYTFAMEAQQLFLSVSGCDKGSWIRGWTLILWCVELQRSQGQVHLTQSTQIYERLHPRKDWKPVTYVQILETVWGSITALVHGPDWWLSWVDPQHLIVSLQFEQEVSLIFASFVFFLL